MEKIHYTYKITNLINEKEYIGDHSTTNIKDGYLGSGVYLKKAIKKYGKKNFRKEILEYFSSKQEAFDAQTEYIIKYKTLAPDGYNISPSGGYGIPLSMLSDDTKEKIRKSKIGDKNPMFGKKISTEHKKIISNIHKNKIVSAETKRKMSESAKKYTKTEEHILKIKNANLGKKQSEETIIKKRNAMLGKNTGPKSIEIKEKMSRAKIGKKFSEEHKRKLSVAAKNRVKIKNNKI